MRDVLCTSQPESIVVRGRSPASDIRPRWCRLNGYTLITGGGGFVGTNLADRLLGDGRRVLVLDNLSRPGAQRNLRWLRRRHDGRVQVQIGDVGDRRELRRALAGAEAVFHLAAQVAVTTSRGDPLVDVGADLEGTTGLLEELRRLHRAVPLLYTSTGKVYGDLRDVPLERRHVRRWEPATDLLRAHGIGERWPIDPCTPHGSSKGDADRCVLDYARSYGLPAVVFRVSSVYGEHQNEGQGWVARFLLRALTRQPLTIHGDGAQVRDVLSVTDLVEAMVRAHEQIDRVAGCAFNVGGGPSNTISPIELLWMIEELQGEAPDVRYAAERPGDQRWYVSDPSRLRAAVGWGPTVGVEAGVASLYDRLAADESLAAAAARA
jgi:CDP-paratose 2-epimerase